MSEDDAFLRKLLEQPNNDLTRLVYADWLDEQQTPDSLAKAEFLRLIADAERAGQLPARAKELAGQLDPQWLAVVTKLPIENCRVEATRGSGPAPGYPPQIGRRFSYECPNRWEELTPTEDGNGVRFCGACMKKVHYCHDADDVRRHADLRDCVAVELGVPRYPSDLEPEGLMMTMGMIAPDDFDVAERERQRIMDETPSSGRAARRRRRRKQAEE